MLAAALSADQNPDSLIIARIPGGRIARAPIVARAIVVTSACSSIPPVCSGKPVFSKDRIPIVRQCLGCHPSTETEAKRDRQAGRGKSRGNGGGVGLSGRWVIWAGNEGSFAALHHESSWKGREGDPLREAAPRPSAPSAQRTVESGGVAQVPLRHEAVAMSLDEAQGAFGFQSPCAQMRW